MRLSDLRPCDKCGGKIAPSFYVLRFSIALFNRNATNQVLGMAQVMVGNLGLAEMFSPDSDDAVTVAMDSKQHKILMDEVFLCQSCYMRPINLAELAEKVNTRKEEQDEEQT